jgi:short-subunit dehydrogenase
MGQIYFMDKKLNIGITGHTKGIGKAIFDRFLKSDHNVVGFSRSNGYDISDMSIQNKILIECENLDIFINNAYYPTAQTRLLTNFINQWKDTSKLIVNISSKLVFYNGPSNDFFEEYINNKKEQNKICEKCQYNDSPKVLNVLPGLVNTDMADIFIAPKIESKSLANLLYDVIKHKDIVSTNQIIVDVPNLDWADVKIKS